MTLCTLSAYHGRGMHGPCLQRPLCHPARIPHLDWIVHPELFRYSGDLSQIQTSRSGRRYVRSLGAAAFQQGYSHRFLYPS